MYFKPWGICCGAGPVPQRHRTARGYKAEFNSIHALYQRIHLYDFSQVKRHYYPVLRQLTHRGQQWFRLAKDTPAFG
jgi:hypothetical protein